MLSNKLFYFILFLSFCSCKFDGEIIEPPKDPPPELPPITTTGEQTIGCKVNGEVWLPGGPHNPLNPKSYKSVQIHEGDFVLAGDYAVKDEKTGEWIKEFLQIHMVLSQKVCLLIWFSTVNFIKSNL